MEVLGSNSALLESKTLRSRAEWAVNVTSVNAFVTLVPNSRFRRWGAVRLRPCLPSLPASASARPADTCVPRIMPDCPMKYIRSIYVRGRRDTIISIVYGKRMLAGEQIGVLLCGVTLSAKICMREHNYHIIGAWSRRLLVCASPPLLFWGGGPLLPSIRPSSATFRRRINWLQVDRMTRHQEKPQLSVEPGWRGNLFTFVFKPKEKKSHDVQGYRCCLSSQCVRVFFGRGRCGCKG